LLLLMIFLNISNATSIFWKDAFPSSIQKSVAIETLAFAYTL
jgi:hypothetical protein